MTLYRKAGSREAIVAALAQEGIDLRRAPLVRERVVSAVAELLQERPLAEITLEAVAARASCSLPAIYDQFGGRQGVLKAVFEQYSPLPSVERLVATGGLSTEPDLRHDVRALYGAVFDQVVPRWPVLRGFIAEVLRDPGSEVGQLFREWYVPRALATVRPMLDRHMARGAFRHIPPVLIVQAFVGPMLLHVASRRLLPEEFGIEPPDRDTTIETFTDIFCRAVGANRDPS